MSLGKEWKRYEELMLERPVEFQNDGEIRIVTDSRIVEEFEKKNGRKIGVVYESPYSIMLVDLVYETEGNYYAYERLIPAVEKGSVVVIPRYKDKFVLLRQYRHSMRGYQYAFPRGYGEAGIRAEDNVKKEIGEELGACASEIQYLGKVVANSGISGERVSVYTCTLENYLEKTGYEGITEVVALEEKQMEKWIHENKIDDGFTLAAYSLFT